jgi:hypothetical protein
LLRRFATRNDTNVIPVKTGIQTFFSSVIASEAKQSNKISVLEPTHLCRRSIFDFARIKREDLFEVVALQQRVPQRPSKIKNTRVS